MTKHNKLTIGYEEGCSDPDLYTLWKQLIKPSQTLCPTYRWYIIQNVPQNICLTAGDWDY